MLSSEASCGGSCGGGLSGAAAGAGADDCGAICLGVVWAGETVDADASGAVGTNMMSLVSE